MDEELLRTFISLAKLKNFTKTAEQLHVVQSTVTSRIKQLEGSIGEALFIRTNKKVALTNAGEIFLPYAKQLLKIYESAVTRINALEAFRDTLNIGVVHSLYDGGVGEMIKDYMKENGDIAIKVTIDHSEELVRLLHENQLDMAFTYLAVKSARFCCEPFKRDEIILVTGVQNKKWGEGITKEELCHLPILSAGILTETFQDWFYSIFPKNYIHPLSLDINSNVVPFLQEGERYSFMMTSVANRFLEDGTLIKVKLLDTTPPKMESYLLMNKNRMHSEAIKRWK